MKPFAAGAAALSLGSTAYAAVSRNCATSDICYSLSIPESTANSGNDDIFFQITGPTSYEWIALGQGNGMAGSNIFVMYTSANGNNVTVSPRIGVGHVMPEHDTTARITVLDGSGVDNGVMTANVLCSNCQTWNGGEMDFTSSSASWIYAYKSGSSLDSDDLDKGITVHDDASAFTWDLSEAQGGNAANPFVADGGSTGSNGASGTANSASPPATSSSTFDGTVVPATCTPITASTAASVATSTPADGNDGCPTSWPPTTRPPASCFTRDPSGHGRPWGPHPTGPPKVKRDNGCPSGFDSVSNSISDDALLSSGGPQTQLLLAHGVIACIAFVAIFPIGGILIRIANFTGLLWVHAALQLFGYLFYIVAFGMGVYIATKANLMNNAHPIIGIALFIVLLAQPVFGLLHHKLFKKYGHRTLWSYLHLWHGRAAIILGMVNGGLGIRLAGDSGMGQKIAYGVVAGIMGLVYIGCIIFGEMKRGKQVPPTYEKSERDQRRQSHQLRDMSGSDDNVQHYSFYSKDAQRT